MADKCLMSSNIVNLESNINPKLVNFDENLVFLPSMTIEVIQLVELLQSTNWQHLGLRLIQLQSIIAHPIINIRQTINKAIYYYRLVTCWKISNNLDIICECMAFNNIKNV